MTAGGELEMTALRNRTGPKRKSRLTGPCRAYPCRTPALGTRAGTVLLLGLVLLPALAAQPFLCTFFDKNGKPLRNVEVRLRIVDQEDASDMPPLYRKSDKDGAAEFPELFPGSYVLEAQLRNHVPVKQFVTAGTDIGVRRTLLRKNEFERIEQKAHRDLADLEFLDAVKGIESLLEFYPEDALLHDILARAYAGLDDAARALEAARAAADLDPERFGEADLRVQGMLLSSRGEQALQRFDLARAREAFEGLREIAPDDPVAYEGLALTYGHLGMLDQALEAIRKAVELDPDNPKLPEIQRVLEDAAGRP